MTSSNDNISYNNNTINSNNNIILDYLGTTETPDEIDFEICPNSKEKYSICSDCNKVFKILLPCDKRDCVICQKKRARHLFRKYFPMTKYWTQDDGNIIQFLTLTFKNQEDLEPYFKKRITKHHEIIDIYRSGYIDRRDKSLYNFKKRLYRYNYVFDYGFINKECDYHKIGEQKYDRRTKQPIGIYSERDSGYHYHYHILFYGPPIDLNELNLSDIWKDVTKDSMIVKLQKVRFKDNKHALRYLLKYVCKVEDDCPEIRYFNDLTKGKRRFQPFGKKFSRGLKKSVEYTEEQLYEKCLEFKEYKKYSKEHIFIESYMKSDNQYIFEKHQDKFFYKDKIQAKLPRICSHCGHDFIRNTDSFNTSSVFDELPRGYKDKKINYINFKRIRMFMKIKEKRAEQQNVIQDKLTRNLNKVGELIEGIKSYLELENNVEHIEAMLEPYELKYLLKNGYIYQVNPSKYNLLN